MPPPAPRHDRASLPTDTAVEFAKVSRSGAEIFERSPSEVSKRPTHEVAPDASARDIIPKGAVIEFTMNSSDSKIYPGIARDAGTFGTPDPSDPAKLVVTTSHPAAYTRKVAVYVPSSTSQAASRLLLWGRMGLICYFSRLWIR